MTRQGLPALLGLCLAFAAAPASGTGPPNAATRFSFRLHAKLAGEAPRRNVFISPLSVGMALAMAHDGAKGGTRRAVAQTLGFQGIDPEEAGRVYAGLRSALGDLDPKVRLEIANSLWANARKDVRFEPGFLKGSEEAYGAEIAALDFSNPAAPGRINSWVSEKTHGKIPKIVGALKPQEVLTLINAVYFKGTWTVRFDKKRTRELDFTLADGRKKKVPVMMRTGRFAYYEEAGLQAVSIPYGTGRAHLIVLLPAKQSSLEKLQSRLTPENWEDWTAKLQETKVSLGLPRFKTEYEASLNGALKSLGMGIAFDKRLADFTGMGTVQGDNLFIGEVKHKTFVEVNEEGTEAAAVTAVGMTAARSAGVPRVVSMIVDRPFFLAIRDGKTGAILFTGSIFEP